MFIGSNEYSLGYSRKIVHTKTANKLPPIIERLFSLISPQIIRDFVIYQ